MNGGFGVSVCRARVSAIAASVAASADDVVGIVVLWGEKATVCENRSFLVLVIYTL